MTGWPRETAARTLVEYAAEIPPTGTLELEIAHVLADPAHALYVFRRARSHVHPLWTGAGPDPGNPWRTGGPDWDAVQAAARLLDLEETEPAP